MWNEHGGQGNPAHGKGQPDFMFEGGEEALRTAFHLTCNALRMILN